MHTILGDQLTNEQKANLQVARSEEQKHQIKENGKNWSRFGQSRFRFTLR